MHEIYIRKLQVHGPYGYREVIGKGMHPTNKVLFYKGVKAREHELPIVRA